MHPRRCSLTPFPATRPESRHNQGRTGTPFPHWVLLKPRYVLITELPQDGSEDLTLLIREHVEYLIV